MHLLEIYAKTLQTISIPFVKATEQVINSTKECLKIPQLQALYQLAQDKLNATKNQKTAFDTATNERRNSFAN